MENYGIYYKDPKNGHIEDDYFDTYPEAEEQAVYISKKKRVRVCIWDERGVWNEPSTRKLIADVENGKVKKIS